ncbi:MAG: CHAP domain-containing protein [Jatrophihabitans sp.]
MTEPFVEDVPPESLPEPTHQGSDDVLGEWTSDSDLPDGGSENVQAIEFSAMGSSAGSAAVANARTQAGVSEQPPGSNCGVPHDRYVVWIAGAGVGCVPWCAYFVGWAFDTSSLGNHDHRSPWGNSGYVPWIYQWARNHNKIVSRPEHGDVFFLNPTDPQHSHMGLVAGADPVAGTIYTCEGNWSDRVLSQVRAYRSGVYTFARI